jgi:hypothetical protein
MMIFFLHENQRASLSYHKKIEKKNYIKIKFLTTKGTSDILTKKHEGLK